MKKKVVIVLLSFTLFSIGCYAGPPHRHHHSLKKANDESAINFVDSYYKKLKKGISEFTYSQYWTKKRTDEFHSLTVDISEATGKDYTLERQHILDVIRMEANCEKQRFISSSVYGVTNRKARLEYEVNNLCLQSTKPTQRKVSLIYVKSNSQWVIENIKDMGIK